MLVSQVVKVTRRSDWGIQANYKNNHYDFVYLHYFLSQAYSTANCEALQG